MSKATAQVFDAAASRAIDAHAIAALATSGYTLMQRAADAAFACLLQNFPGIKFAAICCGKGNNAGDAYLVARLAHQYGINTQVLAVVAPADLQGDADHACRDALAVGVSVTTDPDSFWAALAAAGSPLVFVDGLLGTGLNGAPRGDIATCIDNINDHAGQHGSGVLSIDIPSGVSADSGAVVAQAVRAAVTLSFITQKIGLFTGQGISYAGLRLFDNLGVPDEMYVADGVPLLHWDAEVLPALDANTYKHRQGHVVVAGGDLSMPGAVAMAAEAALRVGAGMVSVVTRAQHALAIVARTPEVMVQDLDAAADVMARADLIVLGPGLGRSDWSRALYELAEKCDKPTVLDADGLYWLAQNGVWRGGELIITPHAAEAARLLACSVEQIQQNRCAVCDDLRQRYQCQGVLKGAGSVVFSESGLVICAHGNAGMASAGMGDVLSGVLGGLLASQPTDNMAAMVRAGVALHSAAADVAVAGIGERSLIATDVTAALPGLLRGGS